MAKAACWNGGDFICDLFHIGGVPTLVYLPEGESNYYTYPAGYKMGVAQLKEFADDGWLEVPEVSFVSPKKNDA